MKKTMRLFVLSLLVVGILLPLAGCSSKSKKGQGEGGEGEAGTLSDQDLALQEKNRWGDNATIPQAQGGGMFHDIFFDYDSSVVPSEYHAQLRTDAETIRANPTMKVEVEGHCDKRGTADYNMALGERRAKAVSSMLVSYGVPYSQISTVSYGEELPLDPSDTEDSYAKNRRAHLAPLRGASN